MEKSTILALALVAGIFFPTPGHASYFSLPVDVNPTSINNSWFDHDSGPGSFLRYDGDTTDNYDGHNGTDFATSTGADVLAPADGEVEEVYWDNCGGWQMHLWHDDIGLSTLYSHLGTTTSATTTDMVSRGEHIADVDTTGSCTTGPHLHFGVTDGANRTTSNRIDPFGWSGGGSDPWTYDLGYLWITNPPGPAFHWSDNFETYSNGSLNGQSGWAGDSSGVIGTSHVYEGSKSLTNSGSAMDMYKYSGFNILDYSTLNYSVAYKSTDATTTQGEQFLKLSRNDDLTPIGPPQYACTFSRGTDNSISLIGDTSTSVAASTTWATNTYKIYEIEVDVSLDSCRGRVDGGSWSSYVGLTYNPGDLIGWVHLRGINSDDNAYWDKILMQGK